MKRSIKMFFALLTIVFFIAPAHANLTSTFDTGFEGWTVWDSKPDDVTNFRWESTGGNPGGFIAADDVGLNATFWFRSPKSWGGDWRQYVGGTIEWDIFLYPNRPFTYYSTNELIIDTVGTGNYLTAELNIIPVMDQWTHFKIDLTRENLTVHGSLTFDEIIQNVESIFIRGEYGTTSILDAEGLDNVRVSALEPPTTEIIGTWDSGIYYYDVAKSKWTKMWSGVPSGDIAAGDFTGDNKADVASNWSSGLWYQNGATLSWTKVTSTAPYTVTAGDITGDSRDEIIGTWSTGIWYRNVAASSWTKMNSDLPSGDIAAGDFTGDGKADVASIWSSGLYYQNGANLSWTKVTGTAPYTVTAGDVTGDGRAEIIGTWSSGIWYRNVAASSWTKMNSDLPSGVIAAGDFTGDGKADVASIWNNGLWYQNGATLGWTMVTSTAPYTVTAGDVTGN